MPPSPPDRFTEQGVSCYNDSFVMLDSYLRQVLIGLVLVAQCRAAGGQRDDHVVEAPARLEPFETSRGSTVPAPCWTSRRYRVVSGAGTTAGDDTVPMHEK